MTHPIDPSINKPAPKGWKRSLTTIRYAMKGLKAAWKYEESFRQQFFVTLIALPLTYFLARSWVEAVLLLGSLMLVLLTELLNSAIEAVVDRISLEHHELSGRAKDVGSAAAFIAMLTSGLIWSSLLLVRLLG